MLNFSRWVSSGSDDAEYGETSVDSWSDEQIVRVECTETAYESTAFCCASSSAAAAW